MKLHRRKKGRSDLDISPLIDVVFILLIFFMVSTTFIKDTQLDLERPSAASGKKASSAALRVVLDQRGQIFVDDTPVKPWMVQTRVRQHLRESSEGAVLVVADRRVVAEKLIEVVDQCRLAGAADVGVVTDAEAG
ncbi:MAG: biopolymer transporter ExbD [Alphaproteobacteria bacterium]|nr:biopolymer transporter ExbD [Alphaproteobacteria bacterium]